RLGWREAMFSGLGWMTMGMVGGNLPMALWIGRGVSTLWKRGGAWAWLAGLVFLLSGLLFRGLWAAPIGVLLAERTGRTGWTRVLGWTIAGLGVYGPLGLLVPIGAYLAERNSWNTGGGTVHGMDRPMLLYGVGVLLKAMATR
ncbi:MAG: hypothetical protein P3W93_008860, partial [Thermus sp.]|nr:hypothetical protein [Thermus sp.]